MMNLPDFTTHLTGMMKWHFSPETGAPFWLEMRQSLDFDPLHEVNTFADLARFPDVSDRLRDIPVEALIPRGLHHLTLAGVFESGGTTGKPKRIVVFEQWLDELVSWRLSGLRSGTDEQPGNTLALVPTGPHIVGAINARRARAKGGLCFSVDLDPRWVKKCIQRNDIA
ncbi:phenazine antibiotic biosynthesis protein, partial [Escherichia coli]|nr:phenazine antibiotic biosynthesis protein [Escherichia coli]